MVWPRAQWGPGGFSDGTDRSGIRFSHENGASPRKFMPETMGGGGLIFDYDADGWPDIFLVDSGSLVDPEAASRAGHRLYRNNLDGTFSDVTTGSGIGMSGFGMGACAADYDNDGRVDLYVTSFGPNVLYRNAGSGRFVDVTPTAGVGTPLWSASCAFGDIDNDGDADLYVTHYVDFDPVDNHKFCGDEAEGGRVYCHPNVYNGLSDILYRNNGDGTFSDVSREAGIYSTEGKGLGVVFGDYDDDGWVDIYVANDSVRNFLYHNQGDGTFVDEALVAGVAFGPNGMPLAGMGTDLGDVDGDGLEDFFVTNLSLQTHNLYRNLGGGIFDEITARSGVGMATRPFVGFGTAFLDFDNDADLDLAVANGDVVDNIAAYYPDRTYPQRNLLLENTGGGAFRDLGEDAGEGFALVKVSRALAVGDLDNDGDLDLVIVNNGQTADVLLNEQEGNHALILRMVGTRSSRDGIGARLRAWVGDAVMVREVRAGSSYLGQNDLRVHFGTGSSSVVDRIEVRWPSGIVDVLEEIAADQIVTVVEGEGATDRTPFSARVR
jgi:hypothetical protein